MFEYKTVETPASRVKSVNEVLNADHHADWKFSAPTIVDGQLFLLLEREEDAPRPPVEYFYHYGRFDRVTLANLLSQKGMSGWQLMGYDIESIYVGVIMWRPRVVEDAIEIKEEMDDGEDS